MNTEARPPEHIVKRNGSVVRYNRERIASAVLWAMKACDRPDPDTAQVVARQVEQALSGTYAGGAVPSVEDIQDVVENVLMATGLHEVARSYIIYRHQRAVARGERAYSFDVTDNVPYKKLYETLRWNTEQGCASVEGLNRIIRTGRFPKLVVDADRRYDREIELAAERIVQGRERLRLAIVAGPSSSGKTTTTIKLAARLQQAGLALRTINLDNYFFELENHPRDEFGDYDYETPQALDLPLIDEHIQRLLAGETVRTPHYDFKAGTRTLDVHPLQLGPNDILLIDSLHGLYDRMTAGTPAEAKFRLYVETLGQFRAADGSLMRWADNRLLRRMIRDRDHRNLKPIQTLTHWHYVRRSELQHIIPFIKRSDCIVNTALPYELPILRKRLFRCIAGTIGRYASDPRRLDAHIRVNRVYELLKPLKTVSDEQCVPPNSLLREFIGGSDYRY